LTKIHDDIVEKLSLKECKAILNAEGDIYTDEQILKIRDYLYKLAAIQVEHFKIMRDEKRLNEKFDNDIIASHEEFIMGISNY
jgi:hypothetical protein